MSCCEMKKECQETSSKIRWVKRISYQGCLLKVSIRATTKVILSSSRWPLLWKPLQSHTAFYCGLFPGWGMNSKKVAGVCLAAVSPHRRAIWFLSGAASPELLGWSSLWRQLAECHCQSWCRFRDCWGRAPSTVWSLCNWEKPRGQELHCL